MKKLQVFVSVLLITLCHVNLAEQENESINTFQFEKLMDTVAAGWNQGDARRAADCFAEDAVYMEPPNKQLYRGKKELFEFFGGAEGRKEAMKMTWHHLMFNQREQIGAGEFTFEFGGIVHGIVIVKIENGKITRWREYWYESDLDWLKFIGDSKF
jgi:ketosteroid isomerase-like protein